MRRLEADQPWTIQRMLLVAAVHDPGDSYLVIGIYAAFLLYETDTFS